jgi:hypothetical protein
MIARTIRNGSCDGSGDNGIIAYQACGWCLLLKRGVLYSGTPHASHGSTVLAVKLTPIDFTRDGSMPKS